MFDINSIDEHLRSYGYEPRFSFDDMACTDALVKSLGLPAYKKFWKSVDKHAARKGGDSVEAHILKLLRNDIRSLRILFSGQISISTLILREIFRIASEFCHTRVGGCRVLELGAFDGWASDFLATHISQISHVDAVDAFGKFKSRNPKVTMIKSKYIEYNSESKYNIIFSILGATYTRIEELINCAHRNSDVGCLFMFALRAQPSEYLDVQLKLNDLGYQEVNEGCIKVTVLLDTGSETFPVFIYKR